MTDTDTAELVAEVRLHAKEMAWGQPYTAGVLNKTADRLTALERERDEARALNNKYAWERDKAREERDVAERRAEAFWKPQFTASQAEVERLKDDAARMDWLVSQHVEVRTPLVYGSRALFVAQTLSDEEDAVHHTDLREQIDRASAALQPQVGK